MQALSVKMISYNVFRAIHKVNIGKETSLELIFKLNILSFRFSSVKIFTLDT